MEKFDAIIIGGGHNGLAAAVHLLSHGWKVAVVEANESFGGAVKTQELTLPGFHHDFAAMNISMFAGSPFFARHKDILLECGLSFVPAPDCFATVFRDDTHLGVSKDINVTVEGINKYSHRDGQKWISMADDFLKDAPYIFELLNNKTPSFRNLITIVKAVRKRGMSWLYNILKLFTSSSRDYLDTEFEHPKIKAMLATWGMHLDFSPDIPGGALFPYLEGMANQNFGMVIGKGGANTIVNAMVNAIKKYGGTLYSGVPVSEILVRNGKAEGVKLNDGTELFGTKAIIANLNPKIIIKDLLPHLSAEDKFAQRMKNFRAGPGTMMIHLAMSDLPKWSAGEALRNFAYVHVAPDMAMMTKAYSEAKDGLLPVEPVLVVGQPTAIDPTRAPEDKHVLWIQVRVVPAEIKGDAAGIITATCWDDIKDEYANRAIDILEKYAPGIRNDILKYSVFSPVDLERCNPNILGGDNLSGSHHPDQSFFLRPAIGYSRYNTSIKQLYMCGASTWPGAGTGAGSGFILAKKLAGK
nr:NAD(P)/FAD-dependent oxidoreductase [Pantoea sp. 201603H]